jgi:hypothetical protein
MKAVVLEDLLVRVSPFALAALDLEIEASRRAIGHADGALERVKDGASRMTVKRAVKRRADAWAKHDRLVHLRDELRLAAKEVRDA